MAAEPFFHINGPERHHGGPPPPHPQGGRAGPQQFQNQQQPHMGAPRAMPGPPRDMLPPDLRQGRTVEVSDVSEDFLSEADMRSRLIEYVVYRFEKMPQESLYNEDGELQLPTWDRAVRTQVTGMSQKQILNEIRYLDQTTLPVVEKKSRLSPPLQRQIDKAQENLVAHEGPQNPIYYQWVLAQIDHQLREIPCSVVSRGKTYHPSSRSKSNSARKRAGYGSSGHKRRKQYERLSLTAYFRREPRPHVNIQMLWNSKKSNQPWPAVPNQMPQPRGPPGPPQPGGPPNRGPGGPPPPPQPGRPDRGPGGRPRPSRGPSGHPPQPMNDRKNGTRNKSKHRDSDSDSEFSDASSCSSRTRSSTSASSVTSGSHSSRGRHGHRNRSRGRSPGRRQDKKKHHAVSNAPRHHGNRGKHCFIDRGPPFPGSPPSPGVLPVPPPPPIGPGPSPGHLADVAYSAGRRDERNAQESIEASRARRLRPRIVQGARPTFMARAFSEDLDDLPHRREFDDDILPIDSLSLDDEYDTDQRHRNERLRREYSLRRQNGSILSEDPFVREPVHFRRVRVGSDYMRRHEGPHYIDIADRSPAASYRGLEPRYVRRYL